MMVLCYCRFMTHPSSYYWNTQIEMYDQNMEDIKGTLMDQFLSVTIAIPFNSHSPGWLQVTKHFTHEPSCSEIQNFQSSCYVKFCAVVGALNAENDDRPTIDNFFSVHKIFRACIKIQAKCKFCFNRKLKYLQHLLFACAYTNLM